MAVLYVSQGWTEVLLMNNKKKNILNAIKLLIILTMMTQGFFFTYTLVWSAVGLTFTNWVPWLLYAIACLTEYGFFKWVERG